MLLLREAEPQKVGVLEDRSRQDQDDPGRKAAQHQRFGRHTFMSSTSCCTACFSLDGVRTISIRTGLHLDAGIAFDTHLRFGALGFRYSSVCVPAKLCGNNVKLSSSGLKVRSVSGVEVEDFGTTSFREQLADQAYDISSEVAAVSGPTAPPCLGLRRRAELLRELVLIGNCVGDDRKKLK